MGIEPTVQIQSVFELPIGNTGVSFLLYHIDSISNGDEAEDLNRSKKYISENENKRYLGNKISDNRKSQK